MFEVSTNGPSDSRCTRRNSFSVNQNRLLIHVHHYAFHMNKKSTDKFYVQFMVVGACGSRVARHSAIIVELKLHHDFTESCTLALVCVPFMHFRKHPCLSSLEGLSFFLFIIHFNRYAAVYLTAGIENLLEEMILQCLPSEGHQLLTATALEHAIANNGDLWGLLQPYAHLNAGRTATGYFYFFFLLTYSN